MKAKKQRNSHDKLLNLMCVALFCCIKSAYRSSMADNIENIQINVY